MNKKTKTSRTALLKKYKLLQQAAKQLKKEFVGIDSVIDEVIESLSSWYLFPEMQEKPLIVNLWGLTGVGKTSLINRMAELIRFTDKNYYFNLGAEFAYNFHDQIEEIYDSVNGDPVILVFDEFQHARSLTADGSDKEFASARLIWQLMDSGKFQILKVPYDAATVDILITHLKYVAAQGVKVSNGKVVEGREIYIKNFNHDRFCERPTALKEWSQATEIYFVPEEIHRTLLHEAPGFFFPTFDVAGKLSQMDAKQSIEFLTRIYKKMISPRIVDCSKSIIFNIGNLDEAYQMSSNFNPDMDADEFHEQSLKINVPQIKNVLKTRFRNEQIARLGNTHIIYPAFNSDSFRKIISMELDKTAAQMLVNHNIKLTFDTSIHELIYNEGVYPSQGTRPVFTTIQQIIKNNLARLLSEIYIHAIPASTVNFLFAEGEIMLSFYKQKTLLHSINIKPQLNLTRLRKNKRDDVQAIIAVHEAGHAVISAVLLHTIPEVVFSTTANQGQSGFVYSKFKWNYVSRNEILSRLALYYGGLIAEKIVFGHERITSGADDDIAKATFFLNSMLKEHGMGKRMAAINARASNTRFFHDDFDNQLEEQAREWMDAAVMLAEKTLRQQQKLLLMIADHLSDHTNIKKDKLRELTEKYAVNFNVNQLIEDGSDLYYRRQLKQKINSISKAEAACVDSFELQLNNKSNK